MLRVPTKHRLPNLYSTVEFPDIRFELSKTSFSNVIITELIQYSYKVSVRYKS